MIEPTDEMAEVFDKAFADAIEDNGLHFKEDRAIRLEAGLAAVLALVERDYDVLPKPQGVRAITNPCLCGADLGPPWDSIPHQRGTRGCRSAP